MEGIVGAIDQGRHDSNLVRLVQDMTTALTDEDTSFEQGYTWSDDRHIAIACVANKYASDWQMAWLDENTLICLNGYVSLDSCDKGASCSSVTDPIQNIGQRIALGYQLRGMNSFRDLCGSFLLLLLNKSDSHLVVVTDRLASRSLFYCKNGNETTFSTDIRAILQNPHVSRQLDPRAVVEFLRFTMIFEDKTLYRDIRSLPPASALTLTPSGTTIESYWRMSFSEAHDKTESYYVEALADAFRRATDRLVQEVDGVGLMLSGGLDSRMIAGVLRSLGKPVTAITFGEFEEGNDEVSLAKRVAQVVDFKHIFIKRDPEYYTRIVPRAVGISNGLYSFFHAHMLGVHDQLRACGITTLIHGWGLDILFSGSYLPKQRVWYGPGRSMSIPVLKELSTTDTVVDAYFDPSAWPYSLALPMDEITAQLMLRSLQALWHEWPREIMYKIAEKVKDRSGGSLYNVHDLIKLSNLAKFRSYLFPLSARYGVKERCPLFDTELLSIYLETPPHMRFNGRVYRKALCATNGRLARIPEYGTGVGPERSELVRNILLTLMPFIRDGRVRLRRLRGKYREYPAAACHSYPDPQILVRETGLKAMVEKVLLQGKYLDLDIIQPATVRRMLELHMQKRASYGEHLGALMTLGLWLEQWS